MWILVSSCWHAEKSYYTSSCLIDLSWLDLIQTYYLLVKGTSNEMHEPVMTQRQQTQIYSRIVCIDC